MLYQTLLLPVLLINGISDLRTRQVWEFPFFVLMSVGMIFSDYSVICIIGFLLFLSNRIQELKWIGIGDLETILLVFTAVGMDFILISYLVLTMLIGWYLITKETSVPLVTFLAAGYVTWYICCIIFFGGI